MPWPQRSLEPKRSASEIKKMYLDVGCANIKDFVRHSSFSRNFSMETSLGYLHEYATLGGSGDCQNWEIEAIM